MPIDPKILFFKDYQISVYKYENEEKPERMQLMNEILKRLLKIKPYRLEYVENALGKMGYISLQRKRDSEIEILLPGEYMRVYENGDFTFMSSKKILNYVETNLPKQDYGSIPEGMESEYIHTLNLLEIFKSLSQTAFDILKEHGISSNVEIQPDYPNTIDSETDVFISDDIHHAISVTAPSISLYSSSLAASAEFTIASDIAGNHKTTLLDTILFGDITTNSSIKIESDSFVLINVGKWNQNTNGYVELGLSSSPKEVYISDVEIGSCIGSVFSLFSHSDGAVIHIANVHVSSCEHFLRISNKENKKLKIVISDCIVDTITGTFISCHDYTSSDFNSFIDRKPFDSTKIDITLSNVRINGEVLRHDTDVRESVTDIVEIYGDFRRNIIPFDDDIDFFPGLKAIASD